MNRIRLLLSLVGVAALLTGCGKRPSQPQLQQVEQSGNSGYFTCIYEGTKREFLVCPSEHDEEQSPVIFMLHGYASNAESFQLDTKMDMTACPQGYTVIYVSGSVTPEDKNCAMGWNSGIGNSSVDDIGFLKALAQYSWDSLGCDDDRTYAVGFSNGAFMVHRLAFEATDTFKGFASVAGMTPQHIWENRTDVGAVSFLQISGTKDDVVPMRTKGRVGNTVSPPIEDTLDFFIAEGKLKQTEETTLSKNATLTKYGGEQADACVWSVVIVEGRHSWPSEKNGNFDTNSLLLEFFDTVAQTPK